MIEHDFARWHERRTITRATGGRVVKSHTEYLTFSLPERMAFVNITAQVEAALRKSGIQEGLCLVNAKNIALRTRNQGCRES